MPTTPNPAAQIAPITHLIEITAGDIQGKAIALSWSGTEMQYLVTSRSTDGPPVWVGDSEIQRAVFSKG